jgi:hypothetical protein
MWKSIISMLAMPTEDCQMNMDAGYGFVQPITPHQKESTGEEILISNSSRNVRRNLKSA